MTDKRTSYDLIVERIARKFNLSTEELLNTPPEKIQAITEKRFDAPMKFVSRSPFIGRGNVLGNRVITTQEVDAKLDGLLK